MGNHGGLLLIMVLMGDNGDSWMIMYVMRVNNEFVNLEFLTI